MQRLKKKTKTMPLLNKIKNIAIAAGLFCMISFGALPMSAASGMSRESRDHALQTILSTYTPWSRVEMSGKLFYSGLPVRPTVKIYMEKDKLIQLSVRAPFLGEVGRLEINSDSLIAVNKFGKKYCCESVKELERTIPHAISYIQNILLGRVIVAGSGELDVHNVSEVDFMEDSEGWLLVPEGIRTAGQEVRYAYAVASAGRTRAMLVFVPGTGVNVGAVYSYPQGKELIEITAELPKKKTLAATLDFSSVKWGGSRMSAISLGSKYRRVSIREFVTNFK